MSIECDRATWSSYVEPAARVEEARDRVGLAPTACLAVAVSRSARLRTSPREVGRAAPGSGGSSGPSTGRRRELLRLGEHGHRGRRPRSEVDDRVVRLQVHRRRVRDDERVLEVDLDRVVRRREPVRVRTADRELLHELVEALRFGRPVKVLRRFAAVLERPELPVVLVERDHAPVRRARVTDVDGEHLVLADPRAAWPGC